MIEIEIKEKPNILKLIIDWIRGNTQTVNFGDYIHFKGKDNKTNNIQRGSMLFGWHFNKKIEKYVHGMGYVEKVDGTKAYIRLIRYTEFKQ